MNYTKNYHLPQWEETDRVMRTDFNQMCADMENGLLTVKTAAENRIQAAKSKAESGDNALKALVTKAQAAADNAQTSANAAQATANAAYCPANKPYAVGTYAGSSSNITVNVGFYPSFLIIASGVPTAAGGTQPLVIATPHNSSNSITFSQTGFTLHSNGVLTSLMYAGRNYAYIAFR